MKTTSLLIAAALGGEPDLGDRLDDAVQRTTQGGFWGTVLVARDGEVVLEKGYGYADYGRTPNTPATLFEIASASKQFTAAAVLRLEMDGRLALDDSIAAHFDDVPDDKHDVTVLHLLTHTSGISPSIGLPYASDATRNELIATALGPPLVERPGARFAYCNVGYALLAALVEVASGDSFESYLERALFEPAGMRDTGFIDDADLDRGRMTARLSPQSEDDATAADWHWSWGYRGMGGVVTTARDLLAWDRALRGDAVLDRQARAKLYSPELDAYACGWRVERTPRNTLKVHHGGAVAGYRVQYARYLDEDAVVVILSNESCEPYGLEQALNDVLFPRPKVSVEIDWEPYELGRYKAVVLEDRARWEVRARDGFVDLVARDPDAGPADGHDFITVHVPASHARKLAADLEGMLAGRERQDPGQDAPSMQVGAYMYPFDPPPKQLELTKSLTVMVQPRYVGRGENGERIVDERITLIVVDGARRNWPVMAKLSDDAARRLLDDLRAAR